MREKTINDLNIFDWPIEDQVSSSWMVSFHRPMNLYVSNWLQELPEPTYQQMINLHPRK